MMWYVVDHKRKIVIRAQKTLRTEKELLFGDTIDSGWEHMADAMKQWHMIRGLLPSLRADLTVAQLSDDAVAEWDAARSAMLDIS